LQKKLFESLKVLRLRNLSSTVPVRFVKMKKQLMKSWQKIIAWLSFRLTLYTVRSERYDDNFSVSIGSYTL